MVLSPPSTFHLPFSLSSSPLLPHPVFWHLILLWPVTHSFCPFWLLSFSQPLSSVHILVLIFLPVHSILEDLFPVLLLPLSLFVSKSCYLFPFLFIQMTIWGFVWSLWNWLCGPEVDLTGGCMFGLVWTRLLFMLQHIKTAEWVFLFLHHLCPNVSQQQLMFQCSVNKSHHQNLLSQLLQSFFFPLTKGWN